MTNALTLLLTVERDRGMLKKATLELNARPVLKLLDLLIWLAILSFVFKYVADLL